MDKRLIEKLRKQDRYAVYFKDWMDRAFVPNPNEVQLLEDVKKLSQSIGMKEGVVIGCFDYRTLDLAFYSDNIQELIGYNPAGVTSRGMEAALSMIYPEDLPELFRFQKVISDAWQKLSKKEKASFEWTYTVRWVHKKTKEVKWYFGRVRPYLVDYNGNIVFDLHVIVQLASPPRLQAYDWSYTYTSSNGSKVIHTRDEPLPGEINLTKKEKEVAYHLMEGLDSKEIAERMGISRETVYTHRKKILKKLKAKNTAEMLKILIASRAGING